jgi:glycosyltransferase involved in cell wall biosynthesis
MRIAIEAQRIFRQHKHGMDFVALETIRQLQVLDKENEYYIIVSPGEDKCLQPSHNFQIIELSCPTYPLWEQVALPIMIRKIKPDILHCTSNTAPLYCKTPLVLTLHDIIFLEKRKQKSPSFYQNLGWYYRKLIVPRILTSCKKIITVSKFEKEQIQRALKLPECQLTAIYNGYGAHFIPKSESFLITTKYLPEKEYLFFLGNTDPKKNTLRTLVAYSQYVKKSDKPLPLLIADLKEPIIDTLLLEGNILSIKPLLRYPGYISNADLPYIYSGARIFLYTSLRESFGIPLLEAMACGTPVITSATSSMPEIGGDGAILTDPYNPKSISDMLLKLEQDPEFYQECVNYGLNRVKKFSWKHTATEVLDLYISLNNKT